MNSNMHSIYIYIYIYITVSKDTKKFKYGYISTLIMEKLATHKHSQSVFFTKKITKRGKESHKDFIIFMIQILLHCIARYKAYIYCVSRWSLHASFHSSECFPKLMLYIKLYVHRFLLICQLPKSNELCFPKLMLSRSQPLAFI